MPSSETQNDFNIASAVLSAFQAFTGPACHTLMLNAYIDSPSPTVLAAMGSWKQEQLRLASEKTSRLSCDEQVYLLHLASQGDPYMVKSLIDIEVDVDSRLNDTTPLYMAANHDQPDIVQALLLADADPDDGYSDGLSPLIISSENGYVNVVKLLLDHGANPAAACEDGAFPLLVAAECENIEILSILISRLSEHEFLSPEINSLKETVNEMSDPACVEMLQQFLQSLKKSVQTTPAYGSLHLFKPASSETRLPENTGNPAVERVEKKRKNIDHDLPLPDQKKRRVITIENEKATPQIQNSGDSGKRSPTSSQ